MSEYKLKTGKLEKTVVKGYQGVETAFVGAYKKIESAFVNAFLEKAEPERTGGRKRQLSNRYVRERIRRKAAESCGELRFSEGSLTAELKTDAAALFRAAP